MCVENLQWLFFSPKKVLLLILSTKSILLYVLFRIRLNSFDDEIVARGFRKKASFNDNRER